LFFNAAEDVIQIELTPYGRERLSSGEFNPVYYSFHDDDILYDGTYAGVSDEEQNDIESRILTTARLKHVNPVQPSFPLGTAILGSENSTGWNFSVLHGCIDVVKQIVTGSQNANLFVPEITLCDLEYDVQEKTDGSLEVQDDYILIEMSENETGYGNENLSISLSLVSEESGSSKTGGSLETVDKETFLGFIQKAPEIVNGLLVREPLGAGGFDYSTDLAAKFEHGLLDSGMLDYYLDVAVDDEIEESVLCAAKKKATHDGSIYKGPDLTCPELEPVGEQVPSVEAPSDPASLACPEAAMEQPTVSMGGSVEAQAQAALQEAQKKAGQMT
jgi:hypothetical protein